MSNNSGLIRGIDPTVTIISKILVIGFVIFCGLIAKEAITLSPGCVGSGGLLQCLA